MPHPSTAGRPTVEPPTGYDALTATGLAVELRPYVASDAPEVGALLADATERSSYHRFFTVSRRAGEAYVELLANPEHTCAATVVVDRGAIVAIGSLHRCTPTDDGAREAEFGLLVADRRHGDGLGTLVLEDLLSRAHVARPGRRRGRRHGDQPRHAPRLPGLRLRRRPGVRERRGAGAVCGHGRRSGASSASPTGSPAPRSPRSTMSCGPRPSPSSEPVSTGTRSAVRCVDHLLRAGYTGRLYAVNPQGLAVGSVARLRHGRGHRRTGRPGRRRRAHRRRARGRPGLRSRPACGPCSPCRPASARRGRRGGPVRPSCCGSAATPACGWSAPTASASPTPTRRSASTRRSSPRASNRERPACSPSPVPRRSPCWKPCARAAPASPAWSPSATRPTSAATTCCPGGSTTPGPR